MVTIGWLDINSEHSMELAQEAIIEFGKKCQVMFSVSS